MKVLISSFTVADNALTYGELPETPQTTEIPTITIASPTATPQTTATPLTTESSGTASQSSNSGLNLVSIIVGIVVGVGGLLVAIIGCLISWLKYKAKARQAGETETVRGFGRYMRHGFSSRGGTSTYDPVRPWLKNVPLETHDWPVLSYP